LIGVIFLAISNSFQITFLFGISGGDILSRYWKANVLCYQMNRPQASYRRSEFWKSRDEIVENRSHIDERG